MTKFDSPLSEEELRQIAAIVEALDRSSLTFLQLQIGDMSLTIGKGDAPLAMTPPTAPVAAAAPPPAPTAARAPAPAPPPKPAARIQRHVEDGTMPIVAPIGGRFYAKPDPGAPPFVSVGIEVNENTTVALVEVMKVFNAVPSGLNGIVTEVCVEDAEIVEAGQALFRVRPQA